MHSTRGYSIIISAGAYGIVFVAYSSRGLVWQALTLHSPEEITSKRGWDVHACFEPLAFSSLYLNALKKIHSDPDAPGHSNVGIRDLLFSLVLSLKPQSVLKIGGHIGSASVVFGEALRINGFGSLTTLEPQHPYYQKLSQHVEIAGLSPIVSVVKGFSHEPNVFYT